MGQNIFSILAREESFRKLLWDRGLLLRKALASGRDIGWMNLFYPCISWKVMKRRGLLGFQIRWALWTVRLVVQRSSSYWGRWLLQIYFRLGSSERGSPGKGVLLISSLKQREQSTVNVGTVRKMYWQGTECLPMLTQFMETELTDE